MKELIRLLYLVVVILPLALILSGPLLVLAGLRGRQKIGPIILNPGRRGIGGRVAALLLGLLVWLAVWGGLAAALGGVVLTRIGSPASSTLQAVVAPTLTRIPPTATPTHLPSATAQPSSTPTPTQPPQTEAPALPASPSPSPSPTPSPLPATPTPLPPTATPVPPMPTPLPTATFTPPATATFTPPPSPAATLSPQEATQAIAAVEAANDLLRTAMVEPSIGNLAALESLWRGEALARAQAFAQDLYQRYLRPLEVTFVYLSPPVVLEGTSPDAASVISNEAWTYTGPRSVYGESFQFTYTLRREGESWVITDYAYGYAPITVLPEVEDLPAPSPTSTVITETVVLTPATQ